MNLKDINLIVGPRPSQATRVVELLLEALRHVKNPEQQTKNAMGIAVRWLDGEDVELFASMAKAQQRAGRKAESANRRVAKAQNRVDRLDQLRDDIGDRLEALLQEDAAPKPIRGVAGVFSGQQCVACGWRLRVANNGICPICAGGAP